MPMWDGAVLVPHLKMNKCSCSFTLAFQNLWFKEQDGVFLGLDLHFGPYGPATKLAVSRQIYSTKQTAHFLLVEECQQKKSEPLTLTTWYSRLWDVLIGRRLAISLKSSIRIISDHLFVYSWLMLEQKIKPCRKATNLFQSADLFLIIGCVPLSFWQLWQFIIK